jgi:hypothetical protein
MGKLRPIAALIAGFLVLAIGPVHAADKASADDSAKFLAGMQPSAGSPLKPLTQDRGWQQHASTLDKAFHNFGSKQLTPIREWAGANLKATHPTMFYMFSGPDFLYANAFFPEATTYVLVGLEPVGQIPDLMRLQQRGSLPGLSHLVYSMRTLLALSYFITKDMRESLGDRGLGGTLPILYVFAARSGKTITDVNLVGLDKDGEVHLDNDRKMKTAAHGVKIELTSVEGRKQTLYYFTTNLANDGVRSSGFLAFCDKLGFADSLIKSASYLLHHGEFSRIRDFLVAKSAVVVQDDSGIPIRFFDEKKWTLHPFGRYLGPLGIFPEGRQAKIAELFKSKSPGKLKFSFGYLHRPGDSNLLMAVNGAATSP